MLVQQVEVQMLLMTFSFSRIFAILYLLYNMRVRENCTYVCVRHLFGSKFSHKLHIMIDSPYIPREIIPLTIVRLKHNAIYWSDVFATPNLRPILFLIPRENGMSIKSTLS